MASSIRLFVPDPLSAGRPIDLSESQAHYVTHVMRRASGDAVMLFNGRDGEWECRIDAPGRRSLAAEPLAQTRPQAAGPDAWLLFAPVKRDATELVVEKATELGVAAIQPVLTARTNRARLSPERMASIAIEAAEQSERLTIPAIFPVRTLQDVLRDWPAGRILVATLEREAAPGVAPARGPVALLVGPEGGFAPAELDVLQGCPSIVCASLGPRILRAETAVIAGLALLLAHPSPTP